MSIFKFFTRRQSETLADNFVAVGSSPVQDTRKVSSEGLLTASFTAKTNQSVILGTEAFFQMTLVMDGSFTTGETLCTINLGRTITGATYFVRLSNRNLDSVNPTITFNVATKNATNFTITYSGASTTYDDAFFILVEVIEYI